MQSVLIVSIDTQKAKQEALRRCSELNISPFDITEVKRAETTTKSGDVKLKQSIGIEDVKGMQGRLHLKPVQGEKKAVLIPDAHLLTTEAQNALLKVLEEPPAHTVFLLTASSKESLLPTVLSRCTIHTLKEEAVSLTKEEREELLELLPTKTGFSTQQAMKQAEVLSKNKEEALTWLEKFILAAREELLTSIEKTDKKESAKAQASVLFIRNIQKTHRQIKNTNANLRLTLEALFLSST